MMNTPMRILIVDDEPLARARIRRLLDGSDFEICGEAADGEGALVAIGRLFPDVVLLDIRMPGVDGMEVAHRLAESPQPPAVIFTTAYDEYALKAFRVNAVNYLLKPIRKEDLLQALSDARILNKAQLAGLNAPQQDEGAGQYIACRSLTGLKRVAMEDILYLQAEHKYVTVVHVEGESLCDQTLKELEQSLAPHVLRVHRNTLINQHRLDRLQRDQEGHYRVHLKGLDKGLAVSRRLVTDVKQFIEGCGRT